MNVCVASEFLVNVATFLGERLERLNPTLFLNGCHTRHTQPTSAPTLDLENFTDFVAVT